jgi:hypothetical protein
MKAERIFVFLCGVILLYCVSFPAARADEWNKKTTVTFSGPVDVSGHRLEAGTYVFKLADTVDRHVVQIFTGDEKQIIATILANPDYRVTPSDKTSIKFSETADDVATMQRDLPEAGIPIKEWFYPGQEFRVKPVAANSLASTLPATSAEATTIPAVSTDTDTPNVTPEAAAELLPSPEEKTVEPAEEKPVESAMVQPQQDPTPATSQDTKQPGSSPDKSEKTPSEMPQTASAVPLVGLLGLISVGVGLSLRQISKRVA